jgi:hypothetical protein
MNQNIRRILQNKITFANSWLMITFALNNLKN